MKVVGVGDNYRIYPDDLKTYNKLPSHTYVVYFSPQEGFYLQKIDDFKNMENKIYGNHEQKINKVVRSFNQTNRSLGVILSGDKGSGKSLFSQLLSEHAVREMDMPVIIVNRAYHGVSDFIENINQEVLVLFDEFEKVFDNDKDDIESQENLLGLFDGASQKKRLYVIIVNHIHRVNEFMVNRPGRFHYHMQFDAPSDKDIETYLKDKIDEEYYKEIKSVISFSKKVKLNYDCLRAIAFELDMGTPFREAISDLNIINTESIVYSAIVKLEDGESLRLNNERLDLFSDEVVIGGYVQNDYVLFEFNPRELLYHGDYMKIDGSRVKSSFDNDNTKYVEGETKVANITLKRQESKGVHFNANAL